MLSCAYKLPTFIVLLILLFLNSHAIAQSCTENNIGFNNNTATNTLTICNGATGNTINGGDPSGNEDFTWEVSTTSASGPFSTVSPNPGDVQNWTISSTYYNSANTYYFRRVVSGLSGANAVCNGNSDVVTLIVLPVVNYGTITSGDESICSGGDPANITFSTAPSGSGSFSYQG